MTGYNQYSLRPDVPLQPGMLLWLEPYGNRRDGDEKAARYGIYTGNPVMVAVTRVNRSYFYTTDPRMPRQELKFLKSRPAAYDGNGSLIYVPYLSPGAMKNCIAYRWILSDLADMFGNGLDYLVETFPPDGVLSLMKGLREAGVCGNVETLYGLGAPETAMSDEEMDRIRSIDASISLKTGFRRNDLWLTRDTDTGNPDDVTVWAGKPSRVDDRFIGAFRDVFGARPASDFPTILPGQCYRQDGTLDIGLSAPSRKKK